MTLFWSALALSLILATGSWMLGRRTPRPPRPPLPFALGRTLLLCVLTAFWTYLASASWIELGRAIDGLMAAAPTADPQLAKDAKTAGFSLVLKTAVVVGIGLALLQALDTTMTAFKNRRKPDASGKPHQEQAT